MDLKKNIYKHGIDNPMIFEVELSSQNKSTNPGSRKIGKEGRVKRRLLLNQKTNNRLQRLIPVVALFAPMNFLQVLRLN